MYISPKRIFLRRAIERFLKIAKLYCLHDAHFFTPGGLDLGVGGAQISARQLCGARARIFGVAIMPAPLESPLCNFPKAESVGILEGTIYPECAAANFAAD